MMALFGCARSVPAPIEYRQGAANPGLDQSDKHVFPNPKRDANPASKVAKARPKRTSQSTVTSLHHRKPIPNTTQTLAPPKAPVTVLKAEAPLPAAKPRIEPRKTSPQPTKRVVSTATRLPALPATLPAPPPRSRSRFAWPVQGRLLSEFGPKPGGLHNDGINIAAENGAPVRAAENGVVVYVGNELRGFGNLLLLRHADGWMTTYAHIGEALVSPGQTVRRGQVVARVGSSGRVSRPKLHFEIRKGKNPVDPTRLLTRNGTA